MRLDCGSSTYLHMFVLFLNSHGLNGPAMNIEHQFYSHLAVAFTQAIRDTDANTINNSLIYPSLDGPFISARQALTIAIYSYRPWDIGRHTALWRLAIYPDNTLLGPNLLAIFGIFSILSNIFDLSWTHRQQGTFALPPM